MSASVNTSSDPAGWGTSTTSDSAPAGNGSDVR